MAEPEEIDVEALVWEVLAAFDGRWFPDLRRHAMSGATNNVIEVTLRKKDDITVTDVFEINIKHLFHRDNNGEFVFEEDEPLGKIRALVERDEW